MADNKQSRVTVRMQKMKENFYFHHLAGRSIAEIADLYQVSKFSIYTVLGEIAQKLGVSRDSLLERPRDSYIREATYSKKEKIEISTLMNETDALNTQIEDLLSLIDHTLSD